MFVPFLIHLFIFAHFINNSMHVIRSNARYARHIVEYFLYSVCLFSRCARLDAIDRHTVALYLNEIKSFEMISQSISLSQVCVRVFSFISSIWPQFDGNEDACYRIRMPIKTVRIIVNGSFGSCIFDKKMYIYYQHFHNQNIFNLHIIIIICSNRAPQPMSGAPKAAPYCGGFLVVIFILMAMA